MVSERMCKNEPVPTNNTGRDLSRNIVNYDKNTFLVIDTVENEIRFSIIKFPSHSGSISLRITFSTEM